MSEEEEDRFGLDHPTHHLLTIKTKCCDEHYASFRLINFAETVGVEVSADGWLPKANS